MRKLLLKVAAAGAVAAALTGVTGGIASAATESGTPSFWLVPGVEVDSLLAPTVPVPQTALAPVDALLTLLNG